MTPHPKEVKEKAFELCDLGFTNGDIARNLNVPVRTISNWLKYYGGPAHYNYASSVKIPEEVKADRDIRLNLVPRDITAALFGDPLPGYSALERR